MAMFIDEAVSRAREVARTVIARDAAQTDREARWPENGIRALQRAGLGGLVLPTTVGGLGLGLLAVARVCEEISIYCPSTALVWGMHHVGAAVLAAKATTEQSERLLVPIARGKHLTSLALSEPGTGANFYLPETQLKPGIDGSFTASGVKSFVTSGGHADSYVISTVAVEGGAPVGKFSCLVIPNAGVGIEWGPPWAGLGMRGNSSRDLGLHGVVVPCRDLLGAEGDQIWYVFKVIAPFFIAAMSGTYLGLAAGALEEARLQVMERCHSHTGAPVATNPIVQHRLGEVWAKVARTRALIYHAALAGEAGAEDALPALLSAKAEVAECVVSVVGHAMSLMGGRAYREHSRIERMHRDARAADVMAPTTDLLRMWTGRAILDLPLLAD
jgi:alkylation response protein AidB-like acyl-CoA dehydrogenase